MIRVAAALLALLSAFVGTAWAGNILTNAQLQAEMGQTCVQQGKPSPCIGPVQFSDLIASASPGQVNGSVVAGGTTQATATPITVQINDVTSAPLGSGVVLPTPVVGQYNFVCNDGTNPLLVYPPAGVSVGVKSANVPVSVAVGQCVGVLALSPTVYKEAYAQAALTTLTYGATVPVIAGAAVANTYLLTLAGNGAQIAAPTQSYIGQQLSFLITQPIAAGPYSVTWAPSYGWANGSAPTLNGIPGSTTEIDCRVTTTAPTLICLGPVNSAFGQRITVAPTAPASTSAFAMQGLSNGVSVITPATTGNVHVTAWGTITTTSGAVAADGIIHQLYYGMGNGPANAAAIPSGSSPLCVQQEWLASAAGVTDKPFSLSCVVGSLVPGTSYWFDLAAESVGHVSVTGLSNVTVEAIELR
jgi:hypothetical protein